MRLLIRSGRVAPAGIVSPERSHARAPQATGVEQPGPARRVVVLHPGTMGAALAAELVAAGTAVGWVAADRSVPTHERAEEAGLTRLESLQEAAGWADTVLSVCPPHASPWVAEDVAATGFGGRFAELNAIAPSRMREVASFFDGSGAKVIDGSLIGPPPRSEARVRLYLAGDGDAIAALRAPFAGTRVLTFDLGETVGGASALKMAYAVYNKGRLALSALASALALERGVLEALDREWDDLPAGTPAAQLGRSAAAAWRWSGEMEEIAAACAEAGLDPGLPEAARALYERWGRHRDRADLSREQLLAELRRAD